MKFARFSSFPVRALAALRLIVSQTVNNREADVLERLFGLSAADESCSSPPAFTRHSLST